MNSPLKYKVYEYLKEAKHATDEQILGYLEKNGGCSMNELNKVLMQLEILGLVNIRWVAKEKRRVEVIEPPTTESSTPAA